MLQYGILMEITYIEEKDFYRIVKVGKALSKGTSPDWRAWRLAYILRRTGEERKDTAYRRVSCFSKGSPLCHYPDSQHIEIKADRRMMDADGDIDGMYGE